MGGPLDSAFFGALGSLLGMSEQQRAAQLYNQQLAQAMNALDGRQLAGLANAFRQAPPPPTPTPTGPGLLPKDLMAELEQADKVQEKVAATVTAFQESRATPKPSPQPNWNGQWFQTASSFMPQNPFLRGM